MRVTFKIIKCYCYPAYIRYLKTLLNHEKEQKKTLDQITSNLLSPNIYKTIGDFQTEFPIRDDNDLALSSPTISKQKILFYEETSGSSGDKKKIPYTKELISSFTTMFKVWLYDILANGPKLKSGQLYFSVSPQFTSNDGHHINDDSDYLKGPLKYVINYFSIVPSEIKQVRNPKIFMDILSHYFIRSEKLEVISIWSPSFLIQILDHINDHRDVFLSNLDLKQIKYKTITFHLPKLREEYKKDLISAKLSPQSLLPNLKLISCWGSQHAQLYLEALEKYFPKTLIQTKGLLATEAPLSIPIIESKSHCPIPSEVFYEFIDCESGREIKLLHEIELNKQYEIVLTQKSGLIRYSMNDLIVVDGFFHSCPTFQFVGRAQDLCDLVGEKMDSNFLIRIFHEHFPDKNLSLVPTSLPNKRAYYTLLSDSNVALDEVENLLMRNVHYKNARSLKQLGKLSLIHHPKIQNMIARYYLEEKLISLGDQKGKSLHKNETNGLMIKAINQYVSNPEML